MSNKIMTSYAQNFEDVILYRALRHVSVGSYIDVGAWHPQLHSVTKWFYDQGWSGVNVEPSKFHYKFLRRERIRDLNLNIAVGENLGELEFYEIPSTGLSSLSRESLSLGRGLGYKKFNSYIVPVWPLARVFSEIKGKGEIHFLKIDVEGLEREVLLGADFRKNRPWIIVVEAVKPGTSEPSWGSWEDLVLQYGYQFVWFDGVNRFYLRHESADLKRHFEVPVNLFDNFRIPVIRNSVASLKLKFLCQFF